MLPASKREPVRDGDTRENADQPSPDRRSARILTTVWPISRPPKAETAYQIPLAWMAYRNTVNPRPNAGQLINTNVAIGLRSMPTRMRAPRPAGIVSANTHAATVIAQRSSGPLEKPTTALQPLSAMTHTANTISTPATPNKTR